MRWDHFFADLESQFIYETVADYEAEAAELTRGYWAELELTDRLRAAVGSVLRLRVGPSEYLSIKLGVVGPDWLGGTDPNGSLVIRLDSVWSIDARLEGAQKITRRLQGGPKFSAVMRSLARRREPLAFYGSDLTSLAQGTIDRVGADHLDLAIHAQDEVRRKSSVLGHRILPFGPIVMIRSAYREVLGNAGW